MSYTVPSATWLNTGLHYDIGDTIFVKYESGLWANGPVPAIYPVPWDGEGDPTHYTPSILSSACIGSLLGYVGAASPEGTTNHPDVVRIGNLMIWTSTTSGTLWLGMNDAVGGFYNNVGSLVVSVGDGLASYCFGQIYHMVDFLAGGTKTHPLNNVKLDITMYYINSLGIQEYSHTFPSVYTNAAGMFFVDVATNPFGFWELAYWLFDTNVLLKGYGWTHIYAAVSTCSISGSLSSSYSAGTGVNDTYLPHTMTENLYVKRDTDNVPISSALANMHSAYLSSPDEGTDSNGLAQFTVYPVSVTHLIRKTGYRSYTPIYDLFAGHDCQVCNITKTALLTALPAVGNASVSFTGKDSIGYYPDNTMQLNYNVGTVSGSGDYRTGAYLKLFRPDNSLACRIPPSGGLEPYSYSPPTKNYNPGSSAGMRGMWLAVLYDSGNVELANDVVFFGTKGRLGHDLSEVCSANKVTISWSGIDPVSHSGSLSANMVLRLYDGDNNRKGADHTIGSASGSTYYTLLGGDDITKTWKATLTDQWGVIIATDYINIIGCNQKLYGSVKTLQGAPVDGAVIAFNLTDIGFGTYSGVSDALGNYMITGFPPFNSHTVTCSKSGYITQSVNLAVLANEWKRQDFVFGSVGVGGANLTGTVIDGEGNPVAGATVWIYDTAYLVYTDDSGRYDIPILVTGTYSLNAIKNNFLLSYQTAIITNLAAQVTKNFTLSRKALETYSANFSTGALVSEKCGIQLDTVTDISESPSDDTQVGISSQQIAVADYTNSRKGAGPGEVNTGKGLFNVSPKCKGKKILPVGGTIGLEDGWAIKAEDIDLANRQMLISFWYIGAQVGDPEVLQANTSYTFIRNITTFNIQVYGIIAGVELQEAFLSICYGVGTSDSNTGDNFAQMFETDFNFNHIAVKLLLGAGALSNPCRINVQLFSTSGYTVAGTAITFGTPIFKDNIVMNPGEGGYIHFYFRTQAPGRYCIRVENQDGGYGAMYIYGMTPNQYYASGYLMKAYREGAEVNYAIENHIYEAPMQTERYLAKKGTKDKWNQYTIDAKNTNLVEIE